MENPHIDANFNEDNTNKINYNHPLVSLLEKESLNIKQTIGQRSSNDMSQTIGLFKKYLLTKAQYNKMGKTNVHESKAIQRSPPRPLLPLKVGSNLLRPPSLLEQELLPGIRSDIISPITSNKSSKAQLTIFYSGAINVYDNVPIDKAQAIMLLAGESSLSNPDATKTSVATVKAASQSSFNLPSVCKSQADLPIARKHSLQRFLEKRRDRIINRSPYTKQVTEEPTSDNCSLLGNQSCSPSPLPSRLGCFFPISAHMG